MFKYEIGTNSWRLITDNLMDSTNRNWYAVSSFAIDPTLGELAIFAGEVNGKGIINRWLGSGFDQRLVGDFALRGIDADLSNNRAYAVGDKGAFHISTGSNLGHTWVKGSLPGDPEIDLLCVSVIPAGAVTRGVIGARGGRLFYLDNLEGVWQQSQIDAPGQRVGDIVDVKIDPFGHSYAVSDSGLLLISYDRGGRFEIDRFGFTKSDLLAVDRVTVPGQNSRNGTWVAGENGEIHFFPQDANRRPPVSFDHERFAFGTVGVGTTKQRTLTLTNRDLNPLTLNITTIGADFASTTNQIANLAPGQSSTLRVIYSPGAAGSDNGTIQISAAGYSTNHLIGLNGSAVTELWTPMERFTDGDIVDLNFRNTSEGWALESGGMWHTLDGGVTWSPISLGTNLPMRAVSFRTATAGWVVGGEAGGGKRVILKVGGANPVEQLVEAGGAFNHVQAVSTSEVWASFEGYSPSGGGAFQKGGLAFTTDGGGNWNIVDGPSNDASFSPTALRRVASDRIFVADGGQLWRYNPTDGKWTEVFDHNQAVVRDIEFFGTSLGWVTGNGHYRTTNGGLRSGDWNFDLITTLATYGIEFTGTTNGWAIGDNSNVLRIFRSTDGGDTWSTAVEESLQAGSGRSLRALQAISNRAWAAGGRGTYYRYGPPLPVEGGSLAVPGAFDLGFIDRGEDASQSFSITNEGTDPVTVLDAFFDIQNGADLYSHNLSLPITLAPGASTSVTVKLDGLELGRHDSVMRFVTDGVGVVRSTSLTATVLSAPRVILVDTHPPGFDVIIDGQRQASPVPLVVRDGDARTGEYNAGTLVDIAAPPTQGGAVSYSFVGWSGSAAADAINFRVALPHKSACWTANYQLGFFFDIILPGVGAGNTPPPDAPQGPWLRLSGANLTVPRLGDFTIDGSMFFSASRISCALASTNFRIPEDTDQPNILAVGAGGWTLDWESGQAFTIHAETPSVDVFNCQIAAPSELDVVFFADGNFELDFALSETFEENHGLFSISSGAGIELDYDHSALALSFGLNGQVNALRGLDGGYLYSSSVNWNETITAGDIFPITLAGSDLPATINLGVLSVVRLGDSSIVLARNPSSGAFELAVNHVDLGLVGASVSDASASASSSGDLNFQFDEAQLGPFNFDPIGTSKVNAIWNVLNGEINVLVPQSTISADGVAGWTDDFTFEEFSFDSSGDFYKKIDLPALEFDGIDIDGGGSDGHNYVRLRRTDGVTNLRIQDRREFLGNTMALSLFIDSAAGVSGTFSGDVNIDAGLAGTYPLGDVTMCYDSSETNYQFQGKFRVLGSDALCVRLKFGSGGAAWEPCFLD